MLSVHQASVHIKMKINGTVNLLASNCFICLVFVLCSVISYTVAQLITHILKSFLHDILLLQTKNQYHREMRL